MPYKDPEKNREYQRVWAQAHTGTDRSKTALFARQAAVRAAKDIPCVDCGLRYPFYVMQLDHIGTDKVGKLSALVRTRGMQVVLAEIAKCEPVCANCHATRTWQRLQTEI
jgi:hypothetical protein